MVYNDYVRVYIALAEAPKQYLYTTIIYSCLGIIINWNNSKDIGI